MPISGLVITLKDAHPTSSETLAALWQRPELLVGHPTGRRLPVAVDTATPEQDKALWQWLNDHPGIEFVDVVCVHFDEHVNQRAIPATST